MSEDTNPPNRPLTALDVCNMALSKLGESPIPGIDPNGTLPARMCYMHYHPVRREVLCACRWSFAVVSTTLHSAEHTAANGTVSLPHTLPTDCLRVLEVGSHGWTLRGRTVFCPAAEVRLLYTTDFENVAEFDPLFTEAFATRLACKLCKIGRAHV